MVRFELWHYCIFVFPYLILIHRLASPFTKVEESFNIQAAHDILTYGVPTQNVALRFKAQYDHMEFPGAVPRTFIGALMLAGIARPILWLSEGQDRQAVVRSILGAFNAGSLIVYAMGVRKAFGKSVAAWFVLLQSSQFHIFYYASRTLPNMFAFGMSTLALRYLLPEPGIDAVTKVKQTRLALYLLTIVTVIFRAELGLLIAAHCVYLLANASTNDARLTLLTRTILPAGLSALLVGLALTVSIDTFFWQSSTPIWPELSAFLSNVFPTEKGLGASAWGTSPWHWYFSSAIPRLLLNPITLPLLAYALVDPNFRQISTTLLVPSLVYTALYSVLPHKETRFLFPIVPSLTTAAALCAARLTHNRRLAKFYLKPLFILVTITTAIISHFVLLPLSSLNYPGAAALQSLHALAHNKQPHIQVHLDNLALQTGVTRFLQLAPPPSPLVVLPGRLAPGGPYRPEYVSGASLWVYDKTENATELLSPAFWEGFDWCIMESPGKAIGPWDIKDVVYGMGKPRVVRPSDEISMERGVVSHERGTWGWLLEAMYGKGVGRAYEALKELVYGRGLTAGWWIEWGLEAKLYVLKKGYPVQGHVPPSTL